MKAVLALASRLRAAGGSDTRTTTALAVLAFAVSTALTLSVVGGLLGFVGRAAAPRTEFERMNAETYVILAWVALVLLVVPIVTLGAAAARLGVARRDARLATLRLLGVTPGEVVGLTVVETAAQGLAGALAGVVLHGVLLPVLTLVPFMGSHFSVGELWVGVPALLVAVLAVPLLAAVSGAISLRRVIVSPLGVARRQTPRRLAFVRLLVALAGLGLFMVMSMVAGQFGPAAIAFLVGSLAVAFATLNVVGPWVLGLFARVQLWRARTPARLLAARRLLDDPKAAWRVVGGLGLAGFVAGCLALLPLFTSGAEASPDERILFDDLATGGMLTLAIAFVLAAVSAGIAQASAVLDRRRELALQHLAGVPVELQHEVRRREVLGPLLFVGVGSAAAALVMLSPLFGFIAVQDPRSLGLLLGCLAGGVLLVLGATEATRPLLRQVLAEPVVRPD